MLLIDSSINDKIHFREEFDVSDEVKKLNNLENIRRNDQTSITNMTDEILNRDYRIDELNKKKKGFNNDVSKVKRYKFKLKEILKDGGRANNRAEFSIEDKLCSLFQTYHSTRGSWIGGAKLNGGNYRRLMKKMKR